MFRNRLIAITLNLLVANAAAQSPLPPSPAADQLLPLEVVVNGTKSGTWLLLERAGALYAPHEALEEWRVRLSPNVQPVLFRGQPYWPLSAVPGFNAKLDYGAQSVELLFSPQAFAATRLTQEASKKPVVSPVLSSAFFNYDLNLAESKLHNAPWLRDLGLISELGVSSGWGVLTSSSAARTVNGGQALGTPNSFVLLETTFTKDYPDDNRTLRIGDSITRTGVWGRNVYFGGVQYGTNFALTPGFISRPLPLIGGVSAAPSTVEMYVNDVLRQVSNVPTGPFAIDNFPVVTGNGEARIVVRDILGRETVIVQPFFTSSQLLAAGLNDWSVEAGSLRRDFGAASAHYGSGFGTATWRNGYSDSLSLEGRAEATRKLDVLGFSAISALPGQLLGSAALVASRQQDLGSGGQWLLGIERESTHGGASLQAQGASSHFRELGLDDTVTPPRLQLAGNVSYATDHAGSFGLGFVSITAMDRTRVTTVSGNYSIRIGERAAVTLTLSHAVAGASGSAAGVSFVLPLDHNRVVTASATSRSGQHEFYAAATQNPGPDSDLGWRVLAGRQQNQAHAEGGLYYQSRYGNLSSEASVSGDDSAVRLGANGGLVLVEGHLFATRRVTESYALAEVAGYGDVAIGLGSNVLTRTDASGVALIPGLSAYQSNSVRIDPKELPVSAEIDSIEQIAVPAWRSAVKVVFPVRTGRGALLKIVLDDGDVAPAGALVHIDGDTETFYVARRGEAFVTGLQPLNRVVLEWNGQRCGVDVTLPPMSPDEIPRVGPLACTGVRR